MRRGRALRRRGAGALLQDATGRGTLPARRPGAPIRPALAIVLALLGCRGEPPPEGPRPRLVVVGLDGLDKDHLDRLIAEGRVPTLARLAERGTLARMRPVEPVLSPVVWTSIASGKSPEKHGVQAWTVTRDGQQRVVDGRNVKVRRFWNILDERGVRTAVISWLVSFPPRPMAHGFLVSDRFTRGDWVGASDAPLYEEGGRDALERTYGVTPAASTEWALSFSPTRADAAAAPFQEAAAGLPGGLFPWARDENTTRLAEAAVKRFDPAVLALYLKGVDEAQHLFLQFTDPGLRAQLAADPSLYLRLGAQGGGLRLPWQGAPLTPEHLSVAASLVDDYVAHTDGLLARVLAAAGGDPDVVVVSDHGFLLRADPGGVPAPDHSDRAVLLLSGPSFRAGATLDDPSALDVTPTLLHLLGHPVPRDADGRVLTEAFAYDRPVEHIATYDATPLVLPEVGNARTPTERLEEERLRTLGYIR